MEVGRLSRSFSAFLLLWVMGLGSATSATYWELTQETTWNPSINVDAAPPVGSIYVGDTWADVAPVFCPENVVNGEPLTANSSPERCTWQGIAIRYYFSEHVCTEPEVWDGSACTVPPACGENETQDPVDGTCVCEDGYSRDEQNMCSADDGGEGGGTSCNSSDSCLSEVEAICAASDAFVMDYQYFGGGQYGYACGIDLGSCDPGQSWNLATQLCVTDTDGDGTGDAFDPEPDNPDVNGDTDGDGVPDSQDSDPNNPDEWNGPDLAGQPITVGDTVDPVGPSTEFNDSAIVAAINETISQNNTTNSLLDDLQNTGAVGNDITADGFSSVIDGLSANNSALNDISEQLEPVDGDAITAEITSLVESTPTELGLPEITEADSSFVSSAGAVFQTAQCVNPNFGGHSIDLCSLQSRIVPLAEWVLWLLTVMFCYYEFHSVLRRE